MSSSSKNIMFEVSPEDSHIIDSSEIEIFPTGSDTGAMLSSGAEQERLNRNIDIFDDPSSEALGELLDQQLLIFTHGDEIYKTPNLQLGGKARDLYIIPPNGISSGFSEAELYWNNRNDFIQTVVILIRDIIKQDVFDQSFYKGNQVIAKIAGMYPVGNSDVYHIEIDFGDGVKKFALKTNRTGVRGVEALLSRSATLRRELEISNVINNNLDAIQSDLAQRLPDWDIQFAKAIGYVDKYSNLGANDIESEYWDEEWAATLSEAVDECIPVSLVIKNAPRGFRAEYYKVVTNIMASLASLVDLYTTDFNPGNLLIHVEFIRNPDTNKFTAVVDYDMMIGTKAEEGDLGRIGMVGFPFIYAGKEIQEDRTKVLNFNLSYFLFSELSRELNFDLRSIPGPLTDILSVYTNIGLDISQVSNIELEEAVTVLVYLIIGLINTSGDPTGLAGIYNGKEADLEPKLGSIITKFTGFFRDLAQKDLSANNFPDVFLEKYTLMLELIDDVIDFKSELTT